MPALADMLSPGDRQRLAAFAGQGAGPDLADVAREAAAESQDTGQTAWLLVAVAVAAAETPDQAHAALERALDGTSLRTLALACLGTITDTVQ